MGRNPWKTFSDRLITARADWSRTKEGTAQAVKRKLDYIGTVMHMLRDRNPQPDPEDPRREFSCNPARMGELEVKILFQYFEHEKKLKPNTLRPYLSIVTQLCSSAGNPVLATMRANPIKRRELPRGYAMTGRRSFNLKTVLSFLDSAKARAETSNDWYDTATYGFTVLAAGFGLRPKELRAIRYGELEKHCWRLRVGFTKTNPDYTCLLPPILPHIERYLELRTRALKAGGQDPENGKLPLVPYLDNPRTRLVGEEGLTGAQLREMFKGLREATGTPIAPKDLRTSFGQILKDAGASMDQCSTQLRHASVKTTQQFYVELRSEDTFSQLQKLFSKGEESKPLAVQ
jgi:integrase